MNNNNINRTIDNFLFLLLLLFVAIVVVSWLVLIKTPIIVINKLKGIKTMALPLIAVKTILKPIITTMAKTLVASVLSKELFFWVMEQYVKSTKNKIDDDVFKLVKALDSGDVKASQEAIKELGLELTKK